MIPNPSPERDASPELNPRQARLLSRAQRRLDDGRTVRSDPRIARAIAADPVLAAAIESVVRVDGLLRREGLPHGPDADDGGPPVIASIGPHTATRPTGWIPRMAAAAAVGLLLVAGGSWWITRVPDRSRIPGELTEVPLRTPESGSETRPIPEARTPERRGGAVGWPADWRSDRLAALNPLSVSLRWPELEPIDLAAGAEDAVAPLRREWDLLRSDVRDLFERATGYGPV